MGAFENIERLKKLSNDFIRRTKEVWDYSERELAQNRILSRYNHVCMYKKQLCDMASDILELAKEIIESNEDMSFDNYFRGIVGSQLYGEPLWDQMSWWDGCVALLSYGYKEAKVYERNESEGRCKYISSSQTIYREQIENGKKIRYVESTPKNEIRTLDRYCVYRNSMAYKVCSLIGDYINSKVGQCGPLLSDVFSTFLEVVCMYIALKNEEKEIITDAKVFRVILPESEPQTTTPAPQAKKVELPPVLNTPKGRKLLQKVINAGYCDKYYNWDDTKWKKGKSRLALACFAYRASKDLNLSNKTYKDDKPTTNWQPFEALFTYQGKEEGKNKLMQAKKDFMRTNDRFAPEEMGEISKLFH